MISKCVPITRRQNFLVTYPHCDVPLDELQRLFTRAHEWEDVEYAIFAAEKHEDGEEHRHIFLKYIGGHNLPRGYMPWLFDIVRSWDIEEGKEENVAYNWIVELFGRDDCMKNEDYLPQPGKDEEDKFIPGAFLRRWHPNIEGVRSPKDAIKYCKKEGKFKEYGKCPWNIKLSKAEMNKLIIEGNLNELVEQGAVSLFSLPNLQRALDIYRDGQIKAIFEKKAVSWFWGPTGTGKTKTAWEEARDAFGEDVWISHTSDQWFDGYCGQAGAIFDDIRSGTWQFSNLLRLLDRYPIKVPVKGGFRQWVPQRIWITAPAPPRELYKNYTTGEPYEGIEQLERRIDRLIEFDGSDRETEAIDSFITTPN